ncbi:MAG: hypothetical protein A2821_01970 [Candidatus Magasanikbacteria bacterium RIFCSPHIGHO2_01_FULL_41_23]|uniref:Addiction module toxin RelE n=1 Tax=Candidatus Magasanikbacteria bacterium RIFCSPLOWO2_01_FULL_40_15 TaxID=1798686 RepID=A0A1F6N2F6_9BACT|nr:MAG: hypothetical protein A2821_01970 [Candidatus Magasanikbacteria bacterium RIFCSPHIGHO2_01_FULL_41_23]OGH67087.1 MAG: hypothetical protein A3C66_00140 [Candidatus Magasanikbacteria bacterium RIFCSPHIGHO2_02_FULL_41_35]OGH75079.1 MAG: hypothetical protein A3F22_04860 [Candidatus Magasanikbacteria bacterium RIFCSPHIGHO2_12_FULL_41_16]OGH78186.1 MAG: hypothetical protein A2983_00020 [Candidatus Magasanikbacteria bacterium RIFCSPLOWO2_01_FULL_40_15]
MDYRVQYYTNSRTFQKPARDFIFSLPQKVKAKIFKYIEELRTHDGYLDEPYSRHIEGKIRELRVDFARSRHRIFYFCFVNKKIILLHGFLKTSAQTPTTEIQRAVQEYKDVVNNPKIYDQKIN